MKIGVNKNKELRAPQREKSSKSPLSCGSRASGTATSSSNGHSSVRNAEANSGSPIASRTSARPATTLRGPKDLRARDGQSTPGRFPAKQRALADPVIDRGTRHSEPRGGCGDSEHVAVPMAAYDERRERLRRFLRRCFRIALRGGRLKGGRVREARFAGTVAQEVPRARRECREPVCENAHDLGRRSFYPCHAAYSPVQCWTTLPSSCSDCEVHVRWRCNPPFYFRDKVGVHACRNE